MPCCKCCCGQRDCNQGDEGKCCCGGTCCQPGQYCCDGQCVNDPCPQCNPACDGCTLEGPWGDNVNQQWFNRVEVENCPCFGNPLPVANVKVQNVWILGSENGSNLIPPANIPAFTWNAGYPDILNGCKVYWVVNGALKSGQATGCDLVGGNDRRCGQTTIYQYRLMRMSCDPDPLELIDITDEALTQIDPFTGIIDPFAIDNCDNVEYCAPVDYFDDPTVVCDA